MVRRVVQLPDELDARAREHEIDLSDVVRHAVERELDRRGRMARLARWLDDLEAEAGPISSEERDEAERWARSGRVAPPPGRLRSTG